MLFAQIDHLSFMRVKLIRQNFGTFFQFMLGWTTILVMFKVKLLNLSDILSKLNSIGDSYNGHLRAGMNDICSPMVILIDNEADAFWCFERAMRRLVLIFLPLMILLLNCMFGWTSVV